MDNTQTTAQTTSGATATHPNGIVIVGGGLAAVRTSEQLRRAEYSGPITIVSDEVHLPYDRPPLSKQFLRGETDDSTLKPREFYEQRGITLRLGAPATGVDTGAKVLTIADGSTLAYDELVIATGLVPRTVASFPDLHGIWVLRSLQHAQELRQHAASVRHAVVVGAGFIGCEVAAALRHLGCDVVLIEPQPTPLATVLGEQIGALIARLHRGEGVHLRTGNHIAEVHGEHRVDAVTLADGTRIPAEMVVVGIGSHPATDWLAGSGIIVHNGIQCDATGATSAPNVWAIGDVAAWRSPAGQHTRTEHWSNVAEQARTLTAALLGRPSPAKPAVPYFWSDQYDTKIQCLGHPRPTDTVHLVADDGRDFLAYYERDGALAAVVGAGMSAKMTALRANVASGTPIAEMLMEPAVSAV